MGDTGRAQGPVGRDARENVRYPAPVRRDTRSRRDLHALNANGMVLCTPRDREAAHRAEVEGIATAARESLKRLRVELEGLSGSA